MLRLPPLDVLQPEALDGALAALGAPAPPRVLAGGTDLLVSLKQGHTPGNAGVLLSIARLPLRGISPGEARWELGAGTSLAEVTRWAAPGALAVVPRAAALVAAPPLRTRATVGGNLCLDTRCAFYNQSAFWRSGRPPCHKAGGEVCHAVPGSPRCHACHQADLPPVLIALGAEVEARGPAGARVFPLEELYSGDGREPLRLAASELLTRVLLPLPPPAAGAGYEKLRPRKGLDFPAASAAVYLERSEVGLCREARIAVGAVGSGPLRVPEAERCLVGSDLGASALEAAAAEARRAARPVKNADFTPAYRRQVVGTLVARAARTAWEAAQRGRSES
ncbi:MAG: FAD binding domain-containing protein [Deferrisomatales bacterium]|nr:FAD binding domain-containing protein [Deferrisomatales bacterium]